MNYVRKQNVFQKIEASCRLPSCPNNFDEKIIFNQIIKSQFNYCLLVWSFCSRKPFNIISKLHEGSIRIVLIHYSSDFNEILENNNDICNHHKNIQTMLIEVFKMKNETQRN